MQTPLTLNNQLYLYQLLSETIGVGKQTLLPHVEEALAQDGIEAADLGAETVRAALELLGSFIELKIFKGGRVYVIVRQQPEWDALLAKAEKAAGKAAASGKPWKRQKKAVKPMKPRRKRERKPKKKAAEVPAAPAAAEAPAAPSAQEADAPRSDDAGGTEAARNAADATETDGNKTASTETATPTTSTSAEIERTDIGTTLVITPKIHADGTCTIRILQENAEEGPSKNMSYGPTNERIEYQTTDVVKQSIVSTIVAKSGETLALGGLVSTIDEETTARVPILADIPWIGPLLFERENKTKTIEELIVLVRPHVILTPAEAQRVSHGFYESIDADPLLINQARSLTAPEQAPPADAALLREMAEPEAE